MTTALHTLLEHAERQRDLALSALLQAEDAARRLQQQAEQLMIYRNEYRQRHPAMDGRSAGIEVLRSHQNFMLRLDQAMEQQQGQMQAADGRCTSLRHALVAHETRVASVRKLLERRGDGARQVAARQDQRRSDEAAQMQQQQRMRNSDNGGGDGGNNSGGNNGGNSGHPRWRLGTETMPLN